MLDSDDLDLAPAGAAALLMRAAFITGCWAPSRSASRGASTWSRLLRRPVETRSDLRRAIPAAPPRRLQTAPRGRAFTLTLGARLA